MTNKQKRKAVHDYQFVVYIPQDKRYIRTGELSCEIAGHSYPYRKGPFDELWLEAFRFNPQNKKKKR